MPKCVPCLGADIKALLKGHYPELGGQLKKIADCADSSGLVLCRGGSGGRRAGGEKRPASPYNIFIGQCLKEQGPMDFKARGQAMKRCAATWRQSKGASPQV